MSTQDAHLARLRTRWSAVGAAVAITLGAGGLFAANAASPESVFVGIEPTRVLDTRIGVGLPGPVVSEGPRNLTITGTIPIVGGDGKPSMGAPVPVGATAVVMNATIVRPTAPNGFVSVRPGDATDEPTTSNLNFTAPGVIIPNAVTVQLPTDGVAEGEVNLYFFGSVPGSSTHVLLDVVGYYVEGVGGPAGPKGDTGDPGNQGPAGLAGVTYLSSEVQLLSGTKALGWFTPACPVGQFAIAGGVDANFSDFPFISPLEMSSSPNPAGRNWKIYWFNSSGEDLDTTWWTVCAEVAP